MKLHEQFEDRIHRETWAKGHYCVRIPTGSRVVGKGRMIAVKTPFDFAAGVRGQAVFFDAKSTAENRFNVGSLVMRTTKVHQFNQLMEAARAGSYAGYLIWFYNLRLITWVPIHVMAERNLVSIAPYHPGTHTREDHYAIDLADFTGMTGQRGAVVPRRTPGLL